MDWLAKRQSNLHATIRISAGQPGTLKLLGLLLRQQPFLKLWQLESGRDSLAVTGP